MPKASYLASLHGRLDTQANGQQPDRQSGEHWNAEAEALINKWPAQEGQEMQDR